MIERSNVVWGIFACLLATTASAEIDDEPPSEYYGIREAGVACLQHMRFSQTMPYGHVLASMLREQARTNDAGDQMVLPVLAKGENI